MVRDTVSDENINDAMQSVRTHLLKKMAEKGRGAFVSPHEASGVIDEEVREFKDEVHANDADKQFTELLDIAVAAIWSIASAEAEHDQKTSAVESVIHP